MNNDQAGTIYYDAIIETKKLKVTAAQAEDIIKGSVGKSSSTTKKAGKEMSSSLNGVSQSLAIVGAGYLSLRGASSFLSSAISDANRYQMSIAGLASVSRAFGQDTKASLQAARDFASDGLIPLAQSTQAFKTALASGYSLEEATQLLAGLKDQAVNNRQAYYDLGGAVNATLEGIKNGNSVLADATGTTKNLSVIAKEAGIGIDQMGSVSQNTAYRTAILNAFLKEASRSMGDAATYADSAAGADARLATSMTNLRIEVGQVANAIRQGAVASLSQFIGSNQEAIITIGSGIAATAAFVGVVYGLSKALLVLRVAMTLIATHPLIAILAVTAGVLAALTVNNLMDELENTAKTSAETDKNLAKIPKSLSDSGKEAKKLTKELSKIDDQVQKTQDDFREQLAELVSNKNESIAQLKSQLDEEKSAYDKSYKDRLYDFNKTQDEEASSHYDKTKALQTQIDFLSRYNSQANRRRLTELQFGLARENSEYDKRNLERQTKYEQDEEAEKLSYLKKENELKLRLTNETALLDKHRAEVESIRGFILLDEIDKLKRSRDEQLKSLGQQRADAIENSKSTSAALLAQQSASAVDFNAGAATLGDSMGKAMGEALKKALKETFTITWLEDFFYNNFTGPNGVFSGDNGKGGKGKLNFLGQSPANFFGSKIFGRASGGPVSAGSGYLVGDNPDGSINKTTEMFVPNRSGTIIPSGDLHGMLGGGGGTTNVTVNLSGTFASSPSERRKVADQIIEAFNQTLRARGVTQLGA